MLVALAGAIALIVAPFYGGRAAREEATHAAERAELEAAKEAKYGEIRDAELDYRTGKLSEQDWRSTDAALRSEAVDLLRRLDRFGPGS